MTINIKTLERIIKGVANHWRLKILFLLEAKPGLSLIDLAEELNGNFKTISEHTKKLANSGLIEKKYKNRAVLHYPSDLGLKFLSYIRKFI